MMLLRRKAITQREGVTGELGNVDDSGPDSRLSLAVQRPAGEPVEAGVLVGQSGADPGLHIAHVPDEIRTSVLGHVAHLLDGLLEPLGGVLNLLQTVPSPGVLSLLQALDVAQVLHEGLRRVGAVEADREGGQGQLVRVVLDLGGVVAEGFDAELRVGDGAARGLDVVGGCRWPRGGGGIARNGHGEDED
ncbi:hypothetical protein TIFTF001_010156 [Ficus carica]|uniref:Uncharacterized protein n=1 Tax=Ficus carica TaxID=3494 RepID=A0AA88D1V5_FICCA|nr:hypothetical protein TIFTF001_010156 [Ficus carica]